MEEGSRAIEAFVAFECSAALAFTTTTVSASMLEGSTVVAVLCFVAIGTRFVVKSSTATTTINHKVMVTHIGFVGTFLNLYKFYFINY